jgi:hypothetical protein
LAARGGLPDIESCCPENSQVQNSLLFGILQTATWQCASELQSLPPEAKVTLLYHVAAWALFGMTSCCLRVDEAGNSISSGDMVIEAQFLFISILPQNSARVWLRHQKRARSPTMEAAQADFIFTMDLSVEDMLGLRSRLYLMIRANGPSLETWSSASGKTRTLVWRANFPNPPNVFDIREPEPFVIQSNMRHRIPQR